MSRAGLGRYAVDDDLQMALVTRISEPFSEDEAAQFHMDFLEGEDPDA